ncbi:MAG: SurA N-terminal domain-containing protein [Rhodospirillum sp.]|nr:SurA N-terminal domain-containing protein [Rhodospirillum sp.]MCF8490379.1 SurA N-terminal domain-containing protein [Rhodospirillum sp.]
MLDALRRGSKSWLAKSLLILLVLSFGVWGVADYLVTGGGTPPAIEVGGQEFGQAYVRDQFNRDMTRMRRQGMDLSTEQAISFGLLGQTVQSVVQGAVLDETGKNLGLTVTDAGLKAAIQDDPLFKGEDGVFDKERLTRLLAANQLSESAYIALRRRDMIRQSLVGPLSDGAQAPDVVVDVLAKHASERRVAEILTLAAAALPEPALEPDTAALEAVYADNIATFTAPEYRTSTALVLTKEGVAKGLEIAAADIQDYYDSHQDEFSTGPTRTVTQALFQDEASAKAALALIRDEGMDLDAAAKAMGTTGAIEMGAIGETDLPAPLPDTIFAQDVGKVGEPVNGPFGWHLFLVTEASEGGVKPLTEVSDRIRDSLAQDKALDSLYSLSAEVEDALGGGATIEEAAKQAGVEPLTVTVDQTGKGPDGAPVATLPATPDFLTNLFDLSEGELGFMTEYDSGFFIQRLDTVIPSAPHSLDEVRTKVVDLWKADRRAESAKEKAASLFERAKAGESLSALDEEEPAATLLTSPSLTRAGQADGGAPSDLPAAVVNAMFNAEKGELVQVDLGDGASILRVTDIHQPAPEVAATERERIAQGLTQSYAQDLSADYLDTLGKIVGVTVNESVVLGAVSNETQPQ